MAKALLPLTGASALIVLLCTLPVTADEDAARLANTLAVQTALQQGREHIVNGDYVSAVKVLESQLARIDGSREYLTTLRDAYRGGMQQLRQAGREAEAQTFQRRLQILDPGTATVDSRQVLTPTTAAMASGSTKPMTVVQPAPTPTPKAPYTARGTSKEESPAKPAVATLSGSTGDPFSLTNLKGHEEAKAILERAEAAFRGQQYREAATLYQQAHQALPDVVKDAQDRWAYCRVHAVVARLNQGGVTWTAAELLTLENEIKQVTRMAPKLEGFCKTVLATVDERRAGMGQAAKPLAVAVKHTERSGRSAWAVAETTNFRVYHNETTDMAEKVARIAEQTKVNMQKKWFGEAGEDWTPRCDIYLHPTGQAYSMATQAPPASPGHSTIQNEGSRILARRVDLHVDHDGMLSAVLPHETTHIVLAGRFGPFQVPRWADEGMSVLSEPADKVERHTRNLNKHRQDQSLFAVGQLVLLNDYPEPRFVGAFYAQSVSVVHYLSSQPGGPQKFVKFVQDGLKDGYDAAVKKHYGIESMAALDMQWRKATFKDPGIDLAQQGGGQ